MYRHRSRTCRSHFIHFTASHCVSEVAPDKAWMWGWNHPRRLCTCVWSPRVDTGILSNRYIRNVSMASGSLANITRSQRYLTRRPKVHLQSENVRAMSTTEGVAPVVRNSSPWWKSLVFATGHRVSSSEENPAFFCLGWGVGLEAGSGRVLVEVHRGTAMDTHKLHVGVIEEEHLICTVAFTWRTGAHRDQAFASDARGDAFHPNVVCASSQLFGLELYTLFTRRRQP